MENFTYLHFKSRTPKDSREFKSFLHQNNIPYSKYYPLCWEFCLVNRELDIRTFKSIARSFNTFPIYRTIKPKLYYMSLN